LRTTESTDVESSAPSTSPLGTAGRLTRRLELNRYADHMPAVWAEANDDMAIFLGEYSGTLKVGAVTTAELN
jgi:hypothetical protein